MTKLASVSVLVLVVLLGGVTVVVQAGVLPAVAADAAHSWPEVAHLRAPVLAAAMAVVACIQLALVCTARLVLLTSADRIFTRRALRWVDALTGSFALAAAIGVGIGVTLDAERALNPGVAILLGGQILGCLAVALLVIVLRSLLVRATTLNDELAEVI